MLTKKVKKRVSFLSLLLISLVVAVFFILKSLTSNILYFKSPTDIQLSQDIIFNKKIRVGGMVKKDSLKESESLEIEFIVTDFNHEIKVLYEGVTPNLFKEDSGVVATGYLDEERKIFIANEILAKHDENYMPIKIEVED